MFQHWNEVRKGAMLNIGQQLRLGRYPGFEEGPYICPRDLRASKFFFVR